jgi:hypothetical protein
MRKLAILTLALAGCQSVSDVTPIGRDTYLVGTQVRGGMTSWAEVRQISLSRANQYCAEQGRKMQMVNMETRGTQGWTPQNADLTFQCLTESDPRWGKTTP